MSIAAALRDPRQDVEPLPGFDWKNFDDLVSDRSKHFVEDRLSRLRVIMDLEDPARRPLQPNDRGRRYHWVDGLGASSALGSARTRFDGDADQVLYEAISNVNEWAEANRALAVCSVTLGGGDDSFNRLQVTVLDNGFGIPSRLSQQRTARGLSDWQDADEVKEINREHQTSDVGALLYLIVDRAFSGRIIEPIDRGHGLHTVGFLAYQWTGTVNLLTASGGSVTWIGRTGQGEGWKTEDWKITGCRGTALQVTLEARPSSARETGQRSRGSPVNADA